MKKKREFGEVLSQPLLFTFAISLTMGFVLSNPDISTSLTNRVEDTTRSELHERMSKIEASNVQQATEISILKTNAVEDKKEIQLLKDRVARLEASASTNFTSETRIERQQRPARLLPAKFFRGKDKNDEEKEDTIQPERFYGPPTNCSELQKLGYTLNGYYLINQKDFSNNTAIQVVYCTFRQPPVEVTKLQTTIGVVGVKSFPVHFYVYLRGHYGKKGRIQFENEFVNIGKGFDWKNQWFLAPYSGIYFISVSGTKDIINKERVTLRALLNGNEIVEALSSTEKTYSPFSFQFSRKLKANDKIELILEHGIIMFFHFTGWMVEQQLDF